MGKTRKDPSKKNQDAIDQPEDIGAGENELGEEDDFDHFLETIDDSSDSEDEADPAQEDENDTEEDDGDDGGDDDDDDEEDMEPEEEGRELNEDEDESDEADDSDDQENSDDQGVDGEGEEGIPIQNGIAGGYGSSSDDSENEAEAEASSQDKQLTVKKHKKDLEKLKDMDPEFFAYLEENDAELLDFNDSEDDSESDEEEALHKPPEVLEEASDSEAEEERLDETSEEHKEKVQKFLKKGLVDINVIAHWQSQLTSTRDITVLNDVIEALQCAVKALAGGEEETGMKWRVDGSANFNALLRLCIKEMKGFSVRFLCGNNNVVQNENKFDQKPQEVRDKSKNKWIRLRPKIKAYMDVLIQLFKCMGNSDAVAAVLRHCLRMSGFWSLLATKCYKMLRSLVSIWSEGEDSCRVLAFLTIIRITNYNKDVFLVHMFKQMYIAYVANCKFTSVNTWPAINFMRSSLVELYLIDTALAYSVAFPFIRQLAIHLRNALSPTTNQNDGKQKKSEASRVVYSWQFIHSLHLWADVLSQAGSTEDENLKLLIYPVVQTCMGTVKLIPTKKFIPIRFHIVRMLIKLQEKTGVFIPVLPLITEVLRLTDFSNKAASKFSVRPIDLTCCLKADASESGYLKAVAENVFETMLGYCKAIATDLGFPEIVTPSVMYLRSFLKKQCKNAEVHKKFKLLLEKIELNSKYISERRSKALEDGTVTLADKKSHKILQVQMQTSKPHPPIQVYAAEYFKVNQKVQLQARKPPMETREERRIPKPSVLKGSSKKEPSGKNNAEFGKPMFETDSEDDEDNDEDFKTKLDSPIDDKKRKRKLDADSKTKAYANSSDEEDINTGTNKKKNMKKKKKAGKKMKKTKESLIDDANIQDEIVDFELSD